MIKPFRLKNLKPETLLYLLVSNKVGRERHGIKTEVVSAERKPNDSQPTYEVEVSTVCGGNVYHFANLVNKAIRSNEEELELIF
jgi:hypothetical protein